MVQTISGLNGWWKLDTDTVDSSDTGNNGSALGIAYETGSVKLNETDYESRAIFNGTTSKITPVAQSLTVKSVTFHMKATSNTKDIIQLNSSCKISIDGSNNITTTGLTNATIYVNAVENDDVTLNTVYHVAVTFDEINADALIFGYSSSYFAGTLQDIRTYSSTLTQSLILGIYMLGEGNPTNNITRVVQESLTTILSDNGVIDSDYDDTDDAEINVLNLQLQPSFVLSPKEELAFFDEDGNRIFLGIIMPLEYTDPGADFKKVTVNNYEQELMERETEDLFEGYSPEELIEEFVLNNSGMTFASLIVTGLIIQKYRTRSPKKVWQAVQDILGRVEGLTYQVGAYRNFKLLEKGTTASPLNITNGTDCIINQLKQDPSNQVTRLKLRGDKEIRENQVELFNGDGSNLIFELPEIFLSSKVEVDFGSGFIVQDIEVDGQTEGVYTTNTAARQIIFNTGEAPPNGTGNVRVTYSFEINVSVEQDADPVVLAKYGVIEKPLDKQWLNKMTDAIAYATKYLETNSTPTIIGTAQMLNTLDVTNIKAGYTIYVTDELNLIDGEPIAQSFTIKRVRRLYPGNDEGSGILIEFGEDRNRLADFFNDNQYRLNQLYEKDNNSAISNKNQQIVNNVQITYTEELAEVCYREYDSDVGFWLDGSGGGAWMDDGSGPTWYDDPPYTETCPIIEILVLEDGSGAILTEADEEIRIEG